MQRTDPGFNPVHQSYPTTRIRNNHSMLPQSNKLNKGYLTLNPFILLSFFPLSHDSDHQPYIQLQKYPRYLQHPILAVPVVGFPELYPEGTKIDTLYSCIVGRNTTCEMIAIDELL